MAQVLKDLSLPAFAFIEDAKEHGVLEGRNVILHVRSASVIEMLTKDTLIALNDNVLTYDFDFINAWGCIEHYVAVLHYSATLDITSEKGMILDEVLKPAANWFVDYMEWEDKKIVDENNEMSNHGKFSIAKDNIDNMFIVRHTEPLFTLRTGKDTDLNKLARALKSCAEYLVKKVGYGRE